MSVDVLQSAVHWMVSQTSVNMDPFNVSTWTNSSTFLQSVLNDSSELSKNNTSQQLVYPGLVLLAFIVLGFPGNILVIVIYIAKMTTSTRVYMFSLAVADTAICICTIVLTLTSSHLVKTTIVVLFILVVAITFTLFLLVFVSVERLIAVSRPHTFNMDQKRATTYICVFLLCAANFTFVNGFAEYMKYTMFGVILRTTFLSASALTIVTCYTIIGVTLLKKAMISRKQVADINIELPNQFSKISSSALTFPNVQSVVVRADQGKVVHKMTAKQARNIKNMFVLFIITAVFIACWLPIWLHNIGLGISNVVRNIYVVNSVVNPLIYGVTSAMFREDLREFYRHTRAKLSCHG